MTVGRLILREILYRKLNFALGVLSVLVAVGCLMAALAFLHAHDLRTEEVVAAKETETQQKVKLLEEDYRKIGVGMGFNLLILPKDQNLSDLYAEDYASKYMPEEYAQKLAKAGLATINHLMPSLQEKVKWPEQQRTILLMGVRGEVFIQSARQKPILEAVPAGTLVVGHELHRSLGLSLGQKAKLLGREFTIHKLNPERGNKDDITVWINLREAQELLGRQGQINAMLALECNCAADRLSHIRKEIGAVLPDTQVIEFATQAVARAEARNRAAAEAVDAIERETQGRARLRNQREALAALLVPSVLVGCAVWIGLLALANVRERGGEIGILRALGLRSRQVLCLFLGKALLTGLAGAALGYLAGAVSAALGREALTGAETMQFLADPRLLLPVLLGAPLLAGLASWLPALLATQQDPAVVLREG